LRNGGGLVDATGRRVVAAKASTQCPFYLPIIGGEPERVAERPVSVVIQGEHLPARGVVAMPVQSCEVLGSLHYLDVPLVDPGQSQITSTTARGRRP